MRAPKCKGLVVFIVGVWLAAVILHRVNSTRSLPSPVSMLPSTVLLVADRGKGSGFAIEPNLIATAGHCVDIDIDYVEAFDGTWHRVVSSWRDDEYDVGFLRVVGKFPAISLGLDPEVLDDVFLLSCIYGDEYMHSITRGRVSYFGRDFVRWSNVVQVDIIGASGSSGGVLINKKLQVVGMCVALDRGLPGVMFFEPVSHILEAYEDYLDATRQDVKESCQEEVPVGCR